MSVGLLIKGYKVTESVLYAAPVMCSKTVNLKTVSGRPALICM